MQVPAASVRCDEQDVQQKMKDSQKIAELKAEIEALRVSSEGLQVSSVRSALLVGLYVALVKCHPHLPRMARYLDATLT